MPSYTAPTFNPDDSIKGQFGDDVAFVILVYFNERALEEGGEGDVEIFRSPSCQLPKDVEFPKECITWLKPTLTIAVSAWEGSPACKGCTVNGKWYPCCPL
jgi:hypothetical protein